MARKKSPHLTDAELRLMDVLWEKASATVSDVADSLPNNPALAYSTVLTTLRILENKGFVRHTKEGRAFVYHPVVGREQARVDALPRRQPAGLVDTTATVEATSVAFERDGTPSIGIVTALLGDHGGRRAIANVRDADTLYSMTAEPWEGRRVKITNDGATNTVGAA